MKIVQIGILAALIACGVLLFLVLKGRQSEQAAVATPATTEQAAAPSSQAVAPSPAEPIAQQATSTAASAPNRWKPAPSTKPAAQKTAPAASGASAPQSKAEQAPAQSSSPSAAASNVAEQTVPAPTPVTPPPPPPPPQPRKVTVAAGTLLPARLGETLDSSRMQPGDTFAANLDQPLVVDGLVIAERGARLEGKVAEIQESGRVRGLAAIAIHLTKLHTSDGQELAIETELFRKQAPTSHGEDAKKVGIGAGLGAAIGAIAGGGKGAGIGAAVGGAAGAGTAAATRGKPAVIPVETRIDFRLSGPLTVTEKLK
jgi:hypothetical protein